MTARPLTCRAFGHAWDEVPATTQPEFGVYIWLRCIHCHTVRRDIVSPHNGELLRRWYDYSESFNATRGEYVPRAQFRQRYLTAMGRTEGSSQQQQREQQ